MSNSLYPQEAEVLCVALTQLIQERKDRNAGEREEFLRSTKDQKQFFGYAVDLSRKETIAALTGESRKKAGRIEVLWNGVWTRVYRTDLKDDVGTSSPDTDSIETYREKAESCYGARTGKKSIRVVDAFSDG
jgi:NAD(P)-dependent dehydrogenase (short-subunit alcohol dehydrogenase family)